MTSPWGSSKSTTPRVVGALLALTALCGCDKGIASGLVPDFSGVWDITYDDAMTVEVRVGDEVIGETVGEQGGSVAFGDSGLIGMLEVDCTREELVCPSEIWPRELTLQAAPGSLDPDGTQLAQPVAGLGAAKCTSRAGSLVTGEVMSVATAHSIRADAVALTAGRVTVVVDGACVSAQLPAGAVIVLSAGYSAAKR